MSLDAFYSKKVLEHFRHPRNMGEIKNPDGVATVGNPVCGDVMKLYLKIGKKGKKEFIKDIKFQTLGCGAAISTSSMVTEMAKGKGLIEAKKVSNKTIIEALGGLPVSKIHCSLLAEEALRKAIDDYLKKKGVSKTAKQDI
jgi:nitrogen fixation NifU-like protein